MSHRKIIHIDMDAFFASIEQRDNPSLRNKPVAVGGNVVRGVVAAASYEARKFGVRSAMPSIVAARKCSNLIFVKPRFDVYRKVSADIRNILFEYTDLVEPLSLDEAYLDVTMNKKGIKSAITIAREIKKKIQDQTKLTSSAGISINKFLAKVASDLHKPDGCSFIAPDKIPEFIDSLPIENFHGIGKVTSQRMRNMGITSGKDLKKKTELELVEKFGKMGRYYFRIAHGQDDRPVEPFRERKSYSAERTYEEDLFTEEDIGLALEKLAKIVSEGMAKHGLKGKTIQLKVRYSDFETRTRQKTIDQFTNEFDRILGTSKELFSTYDLLAKPIRLLGIGLSGLNTPHDEDISQLSLQF